MSDKVISIINSFYERGPYGKNEDKLMLSMKLADGKTNTVVYDRPAFHYYKSDGLKRHYQRVLLKDLTKIECQYCKLDQSVAEQLDRVDYLKMARVNKVMSEAKDVLHKDFNIHGTQHQVEDFYREQLKLKVEPQSVDSVDCMYFDIEVDSINLNGFPNEMEAKAPIYANTMIHNRIAYVDLLFYPNVEECYMLRHDKSTMDDFKAKIMKKEGEYIDEVIIKFYDYELNLIKNMFDLIHRLKPDFVVGWNSNHFDVPTIMGRLAHCLDVDIQPVDGRWGTQYFDKKIMNIVIPKDLWNKGFRNMRYNRSMKSLAHEKDSYFKIPMHSVFADLQYITAVMTNQKKEPSYKLDEIAYKFLKDRKDALPKGITHKNFLYKAYLTSIEYNVHDVILPQRIEAKKSFLYFTQMLCDFSNTRFEKVAKKTSFVANMLRYYYQIKGAVLSNNRHANTWNMTAEEKQKMKDDNPDVLGSSYAGGYVANPNLLDYTGIELYNAIRSNMIHDNVCDFDLKAQYPKIIIACNIDLECLIGMIVLLEEHNSTEEFLTSSLYKQNVVVSENANKTLLNAATRFTEAFMSRDWIKIGKDYMELPDLEDMINIIENQK